MDAGPPHYRRVRRGGPDSSHQVVYNLVGRRWGREILHTCNRRRKKEEEEEEEGKEEKEAAAEVEEEGRGRERKEGKNKGRTKEEKASRTCPRMQSRYGVST